jgi:hypothetical protein
MTLKTLVGNEVKMKITPALKELSFRNHYKADTYWYEAYNSDKGVKNYFYFNFTSFLSIPTFKKRYDKIHSIVDPIIGKYYNNYPNNEYEFTIQFEPKISGTNLEYPTISSRIEDGDDMQYKVQLIKNLIINEGLPMLDKFNDLVYLEKFITELKVENESKFYTFLGSIHFYQFHGFKRMTICKLSNSLNYENICKEEYEFLQVLTRFEPENEKYKYLINIYNDLKKHLDEI